MLRLLPLVRRKVGASTNLSPATSSQWIGATAVLNQAIPSVHAL
jgi:hypothetical protein